MRYKENRQYIRLKAHHLAKYRVVSAERQDPTARIANIQDIGAGGVCLFIDEPLPVSTLIELKIIFPASPIPISALAKISWVKQIGKRKLYKVGAQFVEIEDVFRKTIDEQVKFVVKKIV